MAKMELEVVKTILLAKQQLPEGYPTTDSPLEIEKYQKSQGSIMPKGTRDCCKDICAAIYHFIGKIGERCCFCCL
ncbi:unnamed protein product [Cuscuta campestris]|uniref:Uncharacterized protein n=1 Tax=Cuscuta campestris TaxID=132261 RepID=A0A484LK52_9ASTE|nr:unnamed protein product [Cuscuta campestris]